MQINKMFFLAASSISFPFFICAMEMNQSAPALKSPENNGAKVGACCDRGLMYLCGPRFQKYNDFSKSVSKRCTGQEFPLSVTCQGCSACCTTQALLWDVFLRSGARPSCVSQVCAMSAGCAACLAYLAHRLERFQASKQVSMPEKAQIAESSNSDHSKVE